MSWLILVFVNWAMSSETSYKQKCNGNTCSENAFSADPYKSRISRNDFVNESTFDYPNYISNRKDPIVWSKQPYSNISSILNTISMDELNLYEKNGYLSLPIFFSKSQMQIYNDRLDELIDDIQHNENNSYYTVSEMNNPNHIKSIFEIHKDIFFDISTNERILNIVKQILNSPVYITQSRINLQSAYYGNGFNWHSDFETWHIEDGMSKPRCLSMVLLLENSYKWSGGLMGIPGSHKYYVHTLNDDENNQGVLKKNWETSLTTQYYGTPNDKQLKYLFDNSNNKIEGIEYIGIGEKGSILFFDSNLMHGSHNNISPKSRNYLFVVYNSIHNVLKEPLIGNGRPTYLAERDEKWIKPIDQCKKKIK
eukprot:302249_1